MVGHLFGYHAASTFETTADTLRVMRKAVVETTRQMKQADHAVQDLAELNPESLIMKTKKVQDLLCSGRCNSIMETDTAVQLNDLFNILVNRISLDFLPLKFNLPGTITNLLILLEKHLSEAVNQVSRPIDAIKHQAKTVTVGISRLEKPLQEGPFWELIHSLGLPEQNVPTRTANFLTAFGRLVSDLPGATLYELRQLTPLGQPTYDTTMKVLQQTGASGAITSRYRDGKPLLGTKRQVVTNKKMYLGFGRKDHRRILILPFTGENTSGKLLLVQLELKEKGDFNDRIRALKMYPEHYQSLVSAVTELDIPWSDDLIENTDNTTLFLKSTEETASVITEAETRDW
jgi:glucosamine--fructose-6-phosphate aminotransferase (isomerizing)